MKNAGYVKTIVVAAIAGAALYAPAASQAVQFNPNPWTQTGFLNIAHQGGENEAPSNTLFAFKSALSDRGADMLELDVNLTEDEELVVIHDDTVNSTTERTGSRAAGNTRVIDLTVPEIQALDGSYSFKPGGVYDDGMPNSNYPYRGLAQGTGTPPAGYTADDFQHPTFEEVLEEFPNTLINIEIKMVKTLGPVTPSSGGCREVTGMPPTQMGWCDDHTATLEVAEALAGILNQPQYASLLDNLMVVSFSQDSVDRFNDLVNVPTKKVAIAPAMTGVGTALVGGTPSPDVSAFQIPPRFTTLYPMLPETMLSAPIDVHAKGYALHVFTENDADESDAGYRRFYCVGADGIMTSQPGELDRFLRENNLSKATPPAQRCLPPAATPIAQTTTVQPTTTTCKKGQKLKKGKCVKAKKKKKKGKKKGKG